MAADGRPLGARWWPGTHASERSVVFFPGMAAPQEYFRFFAAFLAKNGWGVLTFDYRSVGASKDSSSDMTATLDDWVALDIPAAVSEVKRRSSTQFLAVVAHSIGGQLLGQSPVRKEIDAALLIAAQRGIPKLYKGRGRLRVYYAYALFTILIRSLGYLPISKFTLPEQCSGQALLQWVRWGRTGVFTDTRGVNVESRFTEYRGPLTAVSIADDDYAPAAAVEALTGLYTSSFVRRETIEPQAYGLKTIGHFGFFHPRAPRALWADAESWLKRLEEEARSLKP